MMLDLKQGERDEDFNENLLLVANEIRKEMDVRPEIEFKNLDFLTPERITTDVVASAQNYVEIVRKYYVRKYIEANVKEDELITTMESKDKAGFQKLRNDYFNTSLEEFVVSKNENQKTIDYRGELVQKLDPIYMDPKHKFIKAHFYSPTKPIFGLRIDTYIINVLVIWTMTLVLYLILYFRLLKKGLNSGEIIIGNKPKSSDRDLI
jgi:hypothetical protein